jgi:hypothetical protein
VITNKQAEKLNIKSHTQISPYLETCCLRMSAVVSYDNAAAEVKYLTGIEVSKSAQQRLVHRQDFDLPQPKSVVEELSADGGNIRMRTPEGEPSVWRGYKAICLHEHHAIAASFQENALLTDWVNKQDLAPTITCLGDGHDGVWNIFKEVATIDSRREILDWYHLMENLQKIGGSNQRLFAARSLLWLGKVNETIDLFDDSELDQSKNFCAYLEKHRRRIVNYYYLQAEQVCSIGSGSIESTIKQIVGEASPKENRRTQISGAQWKSENIPQVLAHRCAYLNGLICDR